MIRTASWVTSGRAEGLNLNARCSQCVHTRRCHMQSLAIKKDSFSTLSTTLFTRYSLHSSIKQHRLAGVRSIHFKKDPLIHHGHCHGTLKTLAYPYIQSRNYLFFPNSFAEVKHAVKKLFSHEERQKRKNLLIYLKKKTRTQEIFSHIYQKVQKRKPLHRLKSYRKAMTKHISTFVMSKHSKHRIRFHKWRSAKGQNILSFYSSKRNVMKNRSQILLRRLRAASKRASITANETRVSWTTHKSRLLEIAKRRRDRILSSAPAKRTRASWNAQKSRLLDVARRRRDRIMYSYHPVTMAEPFQRDWFDEFGYPLTSRDPHSQRFVNPWNSESTNGWKRIKDVWRWKKTRMLGMDPDMLSSSPAFSSENVFSGDVEDGSSTNCVPQSALDKLKLTWIGHATSLLQVSDKFKILIDPVFSHKASPVQFMPETEFLGVPRSQPPSIPIDKLESVDVCLISHDHYDHLDYNSILMLEERQLVRRYVVPLGMKEWLVEKTNVLSEKVLELEWWECIKFAKRESNDSVEIVEQRHRRQKHTRDSVETDSTYNDVHQMLVTCAPAQHWCSRSPFDRNKRLWCSWAVHYTKPNKEDSGENKPLNFYFAGDTGYPEKFPLHRQIGDFLGPFDLAAIPIGAYKPRFFMQDSHCDPFEAVKIHHDLRSKRSVAVHWGTFPLANESYDEPPTLLHQAVKEAEKEMNEKLMSDHLAIGTSMEDARRIDFKAIKHGQSIESP